MDRLTTIKAAVCTAAAALTAFWGWTGWLAAAVEILLTALTYGAGLLLEHLRQRKHLSRLVLTGSILLHFGALLLLRSDWLFSLLSLIHI